MDILNRDGEVIVRLGSEYKDGMSTLDFMDMELSSVSYWPPVANSTSQLDPFSHPKHNHTKTPQCCIRSTHCFAFSLESVG